MKHECEFDEPPEVETPHYLLYCYQSAERTEAIMYILAVVQDVHTVEIFSIYRKEYLCIQVVLIFWSSFEPKATFFFSICRFASREVSECFTSPNYHFK